MQRNLFTVFYYPQIVEIESNKRKSLYICKYFRVIMPTLTAAETGFFPAEAICITASAYAHTHTPRNRTVKADNGEKRRNREGRSLTFVLPCPAEKKLIN
jgi:hypothetical protein